MRSATGTASTWSSSPCPQSATETFTARPSLEKSSSCSSSFLLWCVSGVEGGLEGGSEGGVKEGLRVV